MVSTAQVNTAVVTGQLGGCSLPMKTQRLLQGGCGALIYPSEHRAAVTGRLWGVHRPSDNSPCYRSVAGLFTAHTNTAAVTGRLRGSHMPKRAQWLLQGGCGVVHHPSEHSGCYRVVEGLSTVHTDTAAVTGRLRGCPPLKRTQRQLKGGCWVLQCKS